MDFARQQRDPTRHLIGITCVVLVHAFVIYALMTGLGKKALEFVKKPLQATIVEEIKLPPPPPPPPPKRIEKPPPPPEYVPPPDVPVQTVAPSANTITAVVTTLPTAPPPVVAPPPPPPPRPALVRNPNMLNNCAPSMPGEAIRKNIEGTVVAHLMIDEHGNVYEVKIVQSADRLLDRAVVNALKECKFQARGDKWVGEVPIEFKLQ
jgi:periplasmic protein TonB